jgi:hypothetical protein
MTRLTHRARNTATATAVAVGSLFLGACNVKNELLSPQQPGVISPSATANATAADALYVGALGRWKSGLNGGGNNAEGLWNWEGLFTDEFEVSDTFTQRIQADQRTTATNDGVWGPSIYQPVQQARGRARDAINALLTYDPSATGKRDVGEMYLMMGSIEESLAEVTCNGLPLGETVNGVPQYTQPLTSLDAIKLAESRLDTALTYLTGTDASTTTIKDAVLVAHARAQVDLGDFAGAATEVASVPVSFQYNFEYSLTTSDNEWWIMGGPDVKRYTAGDSTAAGGQILNAIPFAHLNDPRVPVTDLKTKGEDGVTEEIQVNIWGRDDPVPPYTGIDAQLIIAEADLQASNITGMMSVLNNLRTSPQTIGIFKVPAMAALPTPADAASARALLFREKALWQFGRGWRMADMRRLVREYGLTQDKVYPSGVFTQSGQANGTYGTEVVLPVPDVERTNPNFTGCIDQNA